MRFAAMAEKAVFRHAYVRAGTFTISTAFEDLRLDSQLASDRSYKEITSCRLPCKYVNGTLVT